MQSYETNWITLVLIMIAWLGVSMWMGAKKAYFDPWTEKPEDPEGEKSSAT